jgi:hypothetical protein
MLSSLIFMAAQIDNATAIPNNTKGELPNEDVTRHVTSSEVAERGRTGPALADGHTTLGDGHAMPSENAATPTASTKVAKLMDTLLDATSRCYLLLPTDPATDFLPGTMELFSARVLRKAPHNSNPINETAKTSRHAFQLCGPDEEVYRD